MTTPARAQIYSNIRELTARMAKGQRLLGLDIGDKTVGVSTWVGYSSNERKMLTLAVLDAEHAEPGAEVTLVWGEPDGGTSKPTVEHHAQMEFRAIVSPVPYAAVARKEYASSSWRTSA